MKKLILIFLIIPGIIIAQSKLDSLQNLLETATGNEKFNILLELTKVMRNKEPEQAIQYSNKALKIAKNLNDKNALDYFTQSLRIKEQIRINNILNKIFQN